MSLQSYPAITFGLLASVCIEAGLISSEATAEGFYDPYTFCSANSCKKGPSLDDPPIVNEDWHPFESPDLVVWGADVCLGYFLTKDDSAWNGGVPNYQVDELYGIYLTLGDFLARVHIFDWPYSVSESPYAGYGVFRCNNTRWPEQLFESVDKSEIEKWVGSRLSSNKGWKGGIEDWNSRRIGSFRNDALGLSVEIRNMAGAVTISFSADYFGPPILSSGPY